MALRSIVILGAGGNSLGIIDAIEAINAIHPTYRIEGILDDIPENRGRVVLGARVIGKIEDAARLDGALRFVNGISSVASFRRIPEVVGRSAIAPARFETIVHPRATVASSARVGAGTIVLAGSVICPEAVVGDHVIILQNTTINHHTRVGDFTTLSAGITILGYIDIGRNAFIGGGATLAPMVKVGDGALIGAGSVVIRDIPAGRVFAGNPAREIAASPHALR
ncbi:MAG TPA: NeuD/PglB/VioB family sugar acetyltransferase [Usitatibacter sp.]|nr:NeuD/PglB/VioB family sugar acetyltransferase [Usitatibacter sp.]